MRSGARSCARNGADAPRERPEFLAWILDDAGEQDAAAVLAEMPPPARLVYRRVLRPRHDL